MSDIQSNLIYCGPPGCGKARAAYRRLGVRRAVLSRQEHEAGEFLRWRWLFEYTVRGLEEDGAIVRHLFDRYVERHRDERRPVFLVLRRAELLGEALQLELRKLLEAARLRAVLICRSIDSLIDPIVSRCVVLRVRPPSFAAMLRAATLGAPAAPPADLLEMIRRARDSFHSLQGYLDHYRLFGEIAELGRDYMAAARALVPLAVRAAAAPAVAAPLVEEARERLNAMLFANYEERNVLLDLWRYLSAKLRLAYSLDEYCAVAERELAFRSAKKKLVHLDAFFWGVVVRKLRDGDYRCCRAPEM